MELFEKHEKKNHDHLHMRAHIAPSVKALPGIRYVFSFPRIIFPVSAGDPPEEVSTFLPLNTYIQIISTTGIPGET
jgi:hypothetical protein